MNAVFKALIEQGIDANYVELIKEANTGCSTNIKLFHRDVRIPIGKGVRQGDPTTKTFYYLIRDGISRNKLECGVNINGRNLSS